MQETDAPAKNFLRKGAPIPNTARFAEVTAFFASGRSVPTVVVAFVLTIVSWPVTNIVPRSGLDPSWRAGLAMAFHLHVHWGSHVDFTYGPLGFLTVPTLYYGGTALLSLVFLFTSRWLLFGLLLLAARPKFPGYWAILVSYVVGASVIVLVDSADMLMGCGLIIGILAIRSESEHVTTLATTALGVLAGAGFLLKFSVGLLSLAIATIVVASSRRWWRDALFGATGLVVSVVLAWVATANSLSDLTLYLRMSAAIANGFAGAMSYEHDRVHDWYYAAIVLACFLGCLIFGLRSTTRRVQICAGLVFLGYAWVALKEGFVRHDGVHDIVFFGLMLVAFVAVPWPERSPRWSGRMSPSALTLFAGALCVSLLLSWKAVGYVPADPLHIPRETRSLASEIDTILSPGRRDEDIERARMALRVGYDLPNSIVRQLRGQTVAIEPWENSVAWAYGSSKWDPEPVLQQYSAYESSLDELDASFLRSGGAPTRILVQPRAEYLQVFHDPFFGAPSSAVARLCRYVQAEATENWQLLVRVPDRCGRLQPIKTTNVGFGQTVSVPSAPHGDAVIATFAGVGSSLLYRIEDVVLKAREIQLRTSSGTYRFIAGTAGDLHILRVPATLGYSTAYSPPTISSFSLIERDIVSVSGRYRVTFFKLSVKPPANAGGGSPPTVSASRFR